MNLIEMVKAAGVVGAGGAGFPTHVKLNTNVEYFIVNAAECEPLIETDKYLCRTFADRIIRTIPQIAEAIGASKKVIACYLLNQCLLIACRIKISKLKDLHVAVLLTDRHLKCCDFFFICTL